MPFFQTQVFSGGHTRDTLIFPTYGVAPWTGTNASEFLNPTRHLTTPSFSKSFAFTHLCQVSPTSWGTKKILLTSPKTGWTSVERHCDRGCLLMGSVGWKTTEKEITSTGNSFQGTCSTEWIHSTAIPSPDLEKATSHSTLMMWKRQVWSTSLWCQTEVHFRQKISAWWLPQDTHKFTLVQSISERPDSPQTFWEPWRAIPLCSLLKELGRMVGGNVQIGPWSPSSASPSLQMKKESQGKASAPYIGDWPMLPQNHKFSPPDCHTAAGLQAFPFPRKNSEEKPLQSLLQHIYRIKEIWAKYLLLYGAAKEHSNKTSFMHKRRKKPKSPLLKRSPHFLYSTLCKWEKTWFRWCKES